MKKLLIFNIILFITLNSCCTKKDCNGLDACSLNLYGFTDLENDSILLKSFELNSNFQTQIDSFYTNVYFSSDSSYYLLDIYKLDKDYQVFIPKYNKTISLSQYKYKKVGCNSCFPFRPKSDLYDVLESVNLNGVNTNRSELNIYK